MTKKQPKHMFDKPKVKQTLWIVLWVSTVLFGIADLALSRHGHFGDHSIDGTVGFYSLLGLIGGVVCITVPFLIGKIIKVKEDYYDC